MSDRDKLLQQLDQIDHKELKVKEEYVNPNEYPITYLKNNASYSKEDKLKLNLFNKVYWDYDSMAFDGNKSEKEKFCMGRINDLINENGSVRKAIKNYGKNKKNEEQEEIIFTSFIEDKPFLVEQTYKDELAKFCVYDTEKNVFIYVDEYIKDGLTYKPIIDDEVAMGFVALPSEPLEYNNNIDLDEEINSFIYKWLDVDDTYRKYAVLNIRKSWVYDRFHSLNYLRALGEHGTGKSRFQDTLGALHYKSIATSGATTSAPVFRLINKWKGTIIIDEADLKNSDHTVEMIKIINQGYEKNRPILRCDKEQGNKILFFDPYCPKILATRQEFEDKATESRCMTQVMRETSRKDIHVNLDHSFFDEALIIRNKLLMWRFRNYYSIDLNKCQEIESWDIEPRLKQVNSGFLPMFDNQIEIDSFKDWLGNYQREIVETRSNSIEGLLVNSICLLLIDDKPISPTNIIEQAGLKDKKGEYWQPRRLNKYIKVLGFESAKQKKIQGVKYNVYEFEESFFSKLVRKYVFDNEIGTKVLKVLKVCDTAEQQNKLNFKENNDSCIVSSTISTSSTLVPLTIDNIYDEIPKEGIKVSELKEIIKEKYLYNPLELTNKISSLINQRSIMENPKGTFRRV